ncbi:MAG TPA: hypothetical protein VK965_01800, partial [Halomonas sp.]|nr:hypothetical protein [Halomonas sp.]
MIASKSFQWSDTRCYITAIIAGLALGPSADARGEEHALDTLQMHGFLSQALVITDDNNFFGPSSDSDGSLKYTEIGANVSLRPHED